MYHATKAKNIKSICDNGFNASEESRPDGRQNMLGPGVYTTRQYEKCLNAGEYGPVILKVAVYTGQQQCALCPEGCNINVIFPGKVKRIDKQNHPEQKTWQSKWDCAWVPPGCGMVQSEREENCVKSPMQVKVLGVCHGWDKLDQQTKNDANVFQVDPLAMSPREWEKIDELKNEFGTGWTDFGRN